MCARLDALGSCPETARSDAQRHAMFGSFGCASDVATCGAKEVQNEDRYLTRMYRFRPLSRERRTKASGFLSAARETIRAPTRRAHLARNGGTRDSTNSPWRARTALYTSPMVEQLAFNARDALSLLDSSDASALDEVSFGVIGMSREGTVIVYNTFESNLSGLSKESVIGRSLFDEVAPCMNNFMIAQRFIDEPNLDAIIDYVFTLRMRRTPVKLRLLQSPSSTRRYVLVER
jgi:photoactive yellow protein